MARIYTDNDLGSWLTHNGKTGSDAGYTQVNIIEFSDGFARTVGTNIPIEEFEANYKRADEISVGPWDNLNASSLSKELMIDQDLIVPQTEQSSNSNIEQRTSANTHAPLNVVHTQEINESPEQQLIRNAIKLSKKTSDVSLNVDYTIPFDISKIKTVMSTMEIESDVIVDVLISHIKQHPEGFFNAIEKSLKGMFNEPDCKG